MADDSENEMNANNSESEIKYEKISAPVDMRSIATAGAARFKHKA
jgi:hypothetical protein